MCYVVITDGINLVLIDNIFMSMWLHFRGSLDYMLGQIHIGSNRPGISRTVLYLLTFLPFVLDGEVVKDYYILVCL